MSRVEEEKFETGLNVGVMLSYADNEVRIAE